MGHGTRSHDATGPLPHRIPPEPDPPCRWGGRLCVVKESRTTPERIQQMYPRLNEWRCIRDTADPEHTVVSELSRRLGLNTPHIS